MKSYINLSKFKFLRNVNVIFKESQVKLKKVREFFSFNHYNYN